MKRFTNNQRVVVRRDTDGNEICALGQVKRLLKRDDSAWVALDERHPNANHPFPVDDPRGTHVLAWPEDCEQANDLDRAAERIES